ncbi:hypothetical protein SAMN04489860_2258 [Paraoerskovia marina]|uniref:Uncharacterized protein n=1 Tax=Paraoerskovia marina TaxID=545619 RepID=A0A1H1UP69_9CELL|nr:hypothetical protein [Paraoerskovia marina]SDS74344.1 hypothetical protein SAMN04489860_2258 [Paraoerskovia marina]
MDPDQRHVAAPRPPLWGPIVCVALGALVAMMGTVIHRFDVAAIPVGIVIALAVSGSGGVVARAWMGYPGLGGYGIGWFAAVLALAYVAPGGDVLIPGAEAVGYVWILGGALVVAATAFAPRRWFDDTARSPRVDA